MNRLRNILACLTPVLLLAVGHVRAATVVWSDNFETNAASRWYSTGIWKIGSPTAGPATNALGYRTYSGTNCASTQGYSPSPSGEDVRLVCTNYNGSTNLLVPPAGLSPRLRFEQWFSLYNALAYVEVSTNNGVNWTQVSPTNGGINVYDGGGAWSRPSIDLSAYGSQHIQIAFHFTIGGYGNGLGWFVDDVEVDEGAPVLNFPESFEAGEGDWSVDFGGWEIGKPTAGPGAAYAGTNCAATKLSGDYDDYVDSRLISPPFLVPSSGSPQLRFWQWYNLDNAFGWVEINNGVVNGATTTNVTITTNLIAVLNTNIYQLFNTTITNYSAPLYWNQTINGWTNSTKVIGSVTDYILGPNALGQYYYFEAGNAPLSSLGGQFDDYNVSTVLPLPQSPLATNFLALQGLVWNPENGQVDNPVGYFGTNYFYSYSTNTSTVFSQSSWTTISPTNGLSGFSSSSGGWTNVSLDLSSYEGQVIEVAFHFVSGGYGTAPGWFVDDILVTSPPQLTALTSETIYAGQTFTQEFSATNPLLPNATYKFSAPGFPGLQITNNGPTTAVLTWTNTGIVNGALNWTNYGIAPNTYTISVIAADNSQPSQTATNSFQLTIQAPPAPSLTVPANPAMYAGDTLTAASYATNAIVPNALYSFQLLSAPTNATININNGVITWPTPYSQPTGPYAFTVEVTDNSQPPLSTTTNFIVTVTNLWMPTLTVPANQTLYAGQTMTVTSFATNNFLPGDTFEFALISSNLPGMDLSQLSTAGILTWNIPITQPAGIYTNVIQATDNNPPYYSTSGSFQVTVLPAPLPVLTLPPTQFVYAGMRLDITSISATNFAFPGSKYSFAVTNSPPGVSISAISESSGELTWTIAPTNVPSLATISVIVTDNHIPPLGTNGSFLTIISPTVTAALGRTAVHVKGGGIAFSVDTSATNAPWQILATTNLGAGPSSWVPVYTNGAASLMFTDLLATNYLQRYYRLFIP